jgi:mannose-1-phosphate guanylyltransferase
MDYKINNNIILLAGGSGKRLWPFSTPKHPKQFITLPKIGLSSFQLTLKRSLNICPSSNIIITINTEHQNLVNQQIKKLKLKVENFQFIIESTPLNTAKTFFNSCNFLLKQKNDNLSYFFPTDQVIINENNFFLEILNNIDPDKINLFAEKSLKACSNFGYMVKKMDLKEKYFQISKFIEKPCTKQIEDLKKHEIYRNLGIYLAKPSTLFNSFPKEDFLNMPVDKVISEKSNILNATEINFEWIDIGSINNLYQYCGNKEFNNLNMDISKINEFNLKNKEFNISFKNKKLRLIKL